MTASISMPLSSTWADNSTCDVRNRWEPVRPSATGKPVFNEALLLLMVSFLTSSIVKDGRQQEVSKRGREALFRLDRFRELKPNWDSYNAAVPSDAAIERAERFIVSLDRRNISPYFVTPGPNGDVLVQYKCDHGHEAEIWFEKDGSSDMLLITPGKPHYEAPIDMEFLLEHLRSTSKG